MSSREIAALTGEEHKNVLRDVKRMLEDLDDAGLNSELGSYRDENNQERPEYHLPKDLSICLVAGYDAKLRLAIIRRWEELEKAATPEIAAPHTDLAQVLAILATLTAKVDALSLTQVPETLALPAPERSPSLPLIIPLTQPLYPHALPLRAIKGQNSCNTGSLTI